MREDIKERIAMIQRGEVPEGYKKTKLGIMPDSWSVECVKHVVRIENELRTPISREERVKIQGEFPYYGPTQVQDYINNYSVEGQAVLIGEDGDHFLKYKDREMTLLVDGKYSVNNHAHIIRGTKKCSAEWFYYVFMYKNILSMITRQGAARYKLTKEALETIKFQIPGVNEQNKVIKILEQYNKRINVQKVIIEEKRKLKKSLEQKLLNPINFIAGFSKDWKKVKLGEILTERNEYAQKKQGYEHASLTKDGIYTKTERYNRDFLVKDDEKKYKVTHLNDICYNPANLKFGVICKNNLGDAIFSPIYITYEVKDSVDIEFITQYLCRWDFINAVRKYEEGTVYERMAVSSEDFLKFEITIPDIEEQKAIAKILTTADKEIKLLKQQLELFKQEKKAMMQLLLTGIVRVNELKEV